MGFLTKAYGIYGKIGKGFLFFFALIIFVGGLSDYFSADEQKRQKLENKLDSRKLLQQRGMETKAYFHRSSDKDPEEEGNELYAVFEHFVPVIGVMKEGQEYVYYRYRDQIGEVNTVYWLTGKDTTYAPTQELIYVDTDSSRLTFLGTKEQLDTAVMHSEKELLAFRRAGKDEDKMINLILTLLLGLVVLAGAIFS